MGGRLILRSEPPGGRGPAGGTCLCQDGGPPGVRVPKTTYEDRLHEALASALRARVLAGTLGRPEAIFVHGRFTELSDWPDGPVLALTRTPRPGQLVHRNLATVELRTVPPLDAPSPVRSRLVRWLAGDRQRKAGLLVLGIAAEPPGEDAREKLAEAVGADAASRLHLEVHLHDHSDGHPSEEAAARLVADPAFDKALKRVLLAAGVLSDTPGGPAGPRRV